MVAVTYRYPRSSTLTADGGLALATAGGRRELGCFFRGSVTHAHQAARALLAVAEVARTRYFDAAVATRLRDPIVTSNVEVLRFEAFSSCNGVHARFDLDAAGFEAEEVDWGCTNVDVDEPLRAALAGVTRSGPLRLTIGAESLAVETEAASVVERRVPLPERWLRGLGNVQVATGRMEPVARLGAAAARAAIRELPRRATGNRPLHVELGPRGARLTTRPGPDRASIVGPQRLASLTRVLPHVRGLTVLAPPATRRLRSSAGERSGALRPSAWVVELDAARLTLVLSPELYRGFSGEGGALAALVTADRRVTDEVAARLAGQARLDPVVLARQVDAREPVVATALDALAAGGRIGRDVDAGAGFHRDLPYPDELLRPDRPRLDGASALVAAGAVALTDDGATVTTDVVHTVTHTLDGDTCTCRWFARHRGERGPCRHVLAAMLARADLAGGGGD